MTRDERIGIRRALGATRASVRRRFLIEAGVLSGLGGILGVLVALGIGFLVTLVMPRYDARPHGNAALLEVAVSIAVGLVAGYVPASRAASVDPIEALRPGLTSAGAASLSGLLAPLRLESLVELPAGLVGKCAAGVLIDQWRGMPRDGRAFRTGRRIPDGCSP